MVNYVLFEAVAYGFYRFKFSGYDRQELQLERIRTINQIEQGPVFTADAAGNTKKDVILKEVLHPYFGYVVDGKTRKEGCESDVFTECYRRIKTPTDTPFPKRSSDKLIIGVLGGSVAVGTINSGRYESALGQLPEYQGREIIVYGMAGGGLRQPQQAMILNYYYSLGAEFDVLIALDGFNDVVIPAYIYRNTGTHPSYPRSWMHRVANTLSTDLVDLVAEKQNLQNAHLSRAKLMSTLWFRNSPLSNLLWSLSHVNYRNKVSTVDLAAANLEKRDPEQRDFNYEAMGPDYEFTTWEDLYQYSVDMWANSANLMHAAAKANGASYIHFLQPNQYIEGSKPLMSEAEKKTAFMSNGGYGNLYKRIYPRVQEKFEWFEAQGIEFHDLTYMYKDVAEPLYIDNCCHVNTLGYTMLVDRIVETIHQSNLAAEKVADESPKRAAKTTR